MAKKALITGITGQDGYYLSNFLIDKGYEVHGIIRNNSIPVENRICHLPSCIKYHNADMMDFHKIQEVIAKLQPDEMYNLAAQSHVQSSFEQPIYTVGLNALSVTAILETIRDKSKHTKFYQASTSEMFGGVTDNIQNEDTPFHPRSPYACAKVFAHYQTINYRESYDLFACSGMLFNHESPRRGELFVTRKITRAATRIKCGLQKKLFLGNLEAKRDWGFAGDYVEAMWLMLQQDKPDDFVVATGETHSVRDFLATVFDYLHLDWTSYVQEDESFIRPAEVNFLCGDATKANKILNWKPKMSFKQLAIHMAESDLDLASKEIKIIPPNCSV